MKKIYTVTLHTAVDLIMGVEKLEPGKVHHASIIDRRPAGKGLNVARVLKTLDVPVEVLAFVGAGEAAWFREDLDAAGIQAWILPVNGPTRVNTTIIEAAGDSSHSETHIRTSGYEVTGADCETLREELLSRNVPGAVFCFSGSTPPGMNNEDFSSLLSAIRKSGSLVAVDTSGKSLIAAVKTPAGILAPNTAELNELYPGLDVGAGLEALAKQGVELPVVTDGNRGAWCMSSGRVVHVPAPKIEPMSTVGAGDAFLAGLLAGLFRGETVGDALKLAVACGSAAVLKARPGEIDKAELTHLLKEIGNYRQ